MQLGLKLIVFLLRIVVIVVLGLVPGPGLAVRYRGAHDTLLIVTRRLHQLVGVVVVRLLTTSTTFSLILLLLCLLVYWGGGVRLRQNC